jgi:hypothetical protein
MASSSQVSAAAAASSVQASAHSSQVQVPATPSIDSFVERDFALPPKFQWPEGAARQDIVDTFIVFDSCGEKTFVSDVAVSEFLQSYIEHLHNSPEQHDQMLLLPKIKELYPLAFATYHMRCELGIRPVPKDLSELWDADSCLTVTPSQYAFIGQQVVRGRDWRSGDKDGGRAGVVLNISHHGRAVYVRFPFGKDMPEMWCAMGYANEYQVVPNRGQPWPSEPKEPEVAPVFEETHTCTKRVTRKRLPATADAAAPAPADPAAPASTAAAPAAPAVGVKRSRVVINGHSFSSRDPALATWTSKVQISAADRLRRASEADFDRRAQEAIENAATVHVNEPKPIFVPLDVVCAALGYQHGSAPEKEDDAAAVRTIQFYDPHDSFFKGGPDCVCVAFREDFEYVDVDALVDGISPMRRKFLIHASWIYVVYKEQKTWILCQGSTTPGEKLGAIKTRLSFHDARPKAHHHRVDPPQMFVVQTTAKAPTVTCNGKQVHDPSAAALLGQLHSTGIFEYAVPSDSPWLAGALKSTPHTLQPMAHVVGADQRPVLSVGFKKEVSLIQLHKLLIDSKLEGRVTRWGTILLPLLTPAAELLFKRAGGELPKDRIAKLMAAKKAARDKEKADRLAAATAAAADKAAAEKKARADAEAARAAELAKFPTKTVVSVTNYPFLAVKFIDQLRDLMAKNFGAETKFLHNDLKSFHVAISTEGALASNGRALRIGDFEFRCEIDPAVYFLSKHAAAAAADGAAAVVDEEQVAEDAAMLAANGGSASSAAGAPRGADE